jgi:RNA polymerase sigma factor (TIGR02999 family)
MPWSPSADITALLSRMRAGDDEARSELFERVYRELHERAKTWMRRQPPSHTLQATALLHEACLKLMSGEPGQDRTHFLALAASAMRSVLVDHARRKRSQKRPGGWTQLPLDAVVVSFEERALDVVALDEAIQRLGSMDSPMAQAVELAYFGGLSQAEIADWLGLPLRTFQRHWQATRAWLSAELL